MVTGLGAGGLARGGAAGGQGGGARGADVAAHAGQGPRARARGRPGPPNGWGGVVEVRSVEL